MDDHDHSGNSDRGHTAANSPRSGGGDRRSPDFAAQMARAEFGRHYVDAWQIEQTLKHGEIIFQARKREQRGRSC